MITQTVMLKPFFALGLMALAVAAGAVSGWAQEAATPPKPVPETLTSDMSSEPVPVVLPVKYVEPDRMAATLGALGIPCDPSPVSNALIIRADGQVADRARAAVAELDVPPPPVKNVEVVFYFVMAAKDGQPAGLRPCPSLLAATVKHLQDVLGVTDLGVLDTVLLRGRDEGKLQSTGYLPEIEGVNDGTPSQYKIGVTSIKVSAPPPKAPAQISLLDVTCGAEVLVNLSQPGQPNARAGMRQDVGLSSDVDINEGQAAVLGKLSLSAKGGPVYVVVSAQVVPE